MELAKNYASNRVLKKEELETIFEIVSPSEIKYDKEIWTKSTRDLF